MGAAIIGGVGSGIFRDFDVAGSFITITDRTRPDASLATVYEAAKRLLNESYDAFASLFAKLGKKAL